MALEDSRKLRVAAINFLNTAPMTWDFLHAPRAAELSRRYRVEFMLPNICAARLADGSTDIGLVPVAAYATTPGLSVVPGLAIAALGPVRSILLLVKEGRDLCDLKTVALDETSRTSAALVRVLLSRAGNASPQYVSAAPELDTMLANADAALLIGDNALLAEQAGACIRYRCYDLAALWRETTGLPFVFAFWGARGAALPPDRDAITRDFCESLEAGERNLDELLREWTAKISLPAQVVRNYWTRNIHYRLDEDCVAGLEMFFRYAAECGALPQAPRLRFV